MATVPLHDDLRAFAEREATRLGMASASEFVEFLLRAERERASRAEFERHHTLAELAAAQDVKPIARIEQVLGDFWPPDETADEFIAAVRAWRDGRTARS